MAPMLRAPFALLCVLALSGCSYIYGVQAKMSGGRVVFEADPQWGKDCVRKTVVRAGDSRGSAVVWDQSVSYEDECANTFPVRYGDAFKGRSERAAKPQPLRTGVVYTVETTTGATGYGCGRFRLLDDRRVEDLGC